MVEDYKGEAKAFTCALLCSKFKDEPLEVWMTLPRKRLEEVLTEKGLLNRDTSPCPPRQVIDFELLPATALLLKDPDHEAMKHLCYGVRLGVDRKI